MNTYQVFLSWIKIKFRLDNRKDGPVSEEGELWWCSWGLNVGHEQNGKNRYFERPALIIKKFGSGLLWAVPATSTVKSGPLYFSFQANKKLIAFNLSQIRSLSPNRLLKKIQDIPPETLNQVKVELKKLL